MSMKPRGPFSRLRGPMTFPDEVEEWRKTAGWHDGTYQPAGDPNVYPVKEYWDAGFIDPERTFLRGIVAKSKDHFVYAILNVTGSKRGGGYGATEDEAKKRVEYIAQDRKDNARRVLRRMQERNTNARTG